MLVFDVFCLAFSTLLRFRREENGFSAGNYVATRESKRTLENCRRRAFQELSNRWMFLVENAFCTCMIINREFNMKMMKICDSILKPVKFYSGTVFLYSLYIETMTDRWQELTLKSVSVFRYSSKKDKLTV